MVWILFISFDFCETNFSQSLCLVANCASVKQEKWEELLCDQRITGDLVSKELNFLDLK